MNLYNICQFPKVSIGGEFCKIWWYQRIETKASMLKKQNHIFKLSWDVHQFASMDPSQPNVKEGPQHPTHSLAFITLLHCTHLHHALPFRMKCWFEKENGYTPLWLFWEWIHFIFVCCCLNLLLFYHLNIPPKM